MYDMRVHLGKCNWHNESNTYKLWQDMDNFFSPDPFDNLCSKKINCCSTVRLNWKGMPQEFRKTEIEMGWHKH